MLDWIRNFTKSAAEKQQEMLTAYVDDELSAAERRRFEQLMTRDESLRAEVERQRLFKQAIRTLPRRAAPRNFILNKGEFRAPAPQRAVQLYPVLRTATALAAVFVVFVVVFGVFAPGATFEASAPIALATQPFAADEAAPEAASQNVEVTRVVTEAEAADGDSQGDAAADESLELFSAEAPADTAAESDDSAEAEEVEEVVEESIGAEAEAVMAEEASDEESEELLTAPRPGEATDTARAGLDEPPPPEATAAANVGQTALPTPRAEEVTISETSREAPVDIPWLLLLALASFIILLAITLYARRQKNTF